MTDKERKELLDDLAKQRDQVHVQYIRMSDIMHSVQNLNIGDMCVATNNSKAHIVGKIEDITNRGVKLEGIEGVYITVDKLSEDVLKQLYTDVSEQK